VSLNQLLAEFGSCTPLLSRPIHSKELIRSWRPLGKVSGAATKLLSSSVTEPYPSVRRNIVVNHWRHTVSRASQQRLFECAYTFGACNGLPGLNGSQTMKA